MENLTEMNEAIGECETRMDIPGSLPIEIFHEILKYLAPGDLHNARDCCKKWRNHMESFWKIKCKIEGYFEDDDDLNSKFYRNFVKKFSRWEGIYFYNSKLEANWMTHNYKEVVNEVDKLNGFTIQYVCGDEIITTYGYEQICVLSAITGKIEKRFYLTFPEGIHINKIHAIDKIDDGFIAVVGTITLDEQGFNKYPEVLHVKAWNIKTEEPLLNLQMESIDFCIGGVLIYKDLITLFSEVPYGIQIYNIKKEQFDYDQCCISSVCYCNDKIAMGNPEGTIVIRDLDYTELMTLNCCESDRIVIEVHMKGNYLVSLSGSFGQPGIKACIWNIETKTKLYEIEKVFQKNLAIYLHENKLYYECGDYQIGKVSLKLCNLNSGECILEFENACVGTVNSFLLKSESNYRLLKLWSIKTGKLISDLELSQPLTYNFFTNQYREGKSKSKFAYIEFDNKLGKRIIKIMDFEAKIE